MSDERYSPGKTTIAPDVLVSIARLTSLSIEGVSRMAAVPGKLNKLVRKDASDGVQIFVENNTVYADIYVVLHRDINVREVSHAIQHQVARAIKDMVGMEVGKVNVHVEDIDYSA